MASIFSAVDHLHSHRVVHRDLKLEKYDDKIKMKNPFSLAAINNIYSKSLLKEVHNCVLKRNFAFHN